MKSIFIRVYFFFFKIIFNVIEKNSIYYEKSFFNRISLINFGIFKFGLNCRYLEIGVFQDTVFNSIPLPLEKKIGVDPVQGGTHRMTSDDFFINNHLKFDIIFIDGLHTYDQVKRDFINSYNSLSDEGIIYIHDMLPTKSIYQNFKRRTSTWNGDVWKLALQLSTSDNFKNNFIIANIDFGIGIFKKKTNLVNLDFLNKDFSVLSYNDFKISKSVLPIRSVFDSINFINKG
jgi:hypothetical protein